MAHHELSVPLHFNPDKVGEVWKVPYQERAKEARKWAERYNIRPASDDLFKICLVAVDVQNTFCIPKFELYVGGRSGTGAIDDNRRLCNNPDLSNDGHTPGYADFSSYLFGQ
jgi:hypothetical protein